VVLEKSMIGAKGKEQNKLLPGKRAKPLTVILSDLKNTVYIFYKYKE
jgi:hypothetical protein